jgi:hypothetical protein
MPAQIHQFSDAKLYALCRKYGEIAVKYRHKFAGLLPEVYRRGLYKKKGYGSVFEFAAKLAGMSEEQVRRVLNLEKRFEAMPVLREMLVSGEVSVNKLARIASVATPDNEAFLATQVKLLPQTAVEVLVRDLNEPESVRAHTNPSQIGEQASAEFPKKRIIGNDALAALNSAKDELILSDEVKKKLLELQQKGIDINALILEFLQKREMEIAQEKEALVAEAHDTNSRYIPVRVKKSLQKEHGTKCSIKTCTRPANTIHHTQRFSLGRTHDPRFLAPLCREHHILAHTVDLQFHNRRLASGP